VIDRFFDYGDLFFVGYLDDFVTDNLAGCVFLFQQSVQELPQGVHSSPVTILESELEEIIQLDPLTAEEALVDYPVGGLAVALLELEPRIQQVLEEVGPVAIKELVHQLRAVIILGEEIKIGSSVPDYSLQCDPV